MRSYSVSHLYPFSSSSAISIFLYSLTKIDHVEISKIRVICPCFQYLVNVPVFYIVTYNNYEVRERSEGSDLSLCSQSSLILLTIYCDRLNRQVGLSVVYRSRWRRKLSTLETSGYILIISTKLWKKSILWGRALNSVQMKVYFLFKWEMTRVNVGWVFQ